jgi:predicted 3-demethylubiquinone-9 3-methyltransferase (glyoxalase superfamily)
VTSATPFLMFQGAKARAALEFYAEHVSGSRIDSPGTNNRRGTAGR